MITTFERLPNEILIIIFSNLSCLEALKSLWSLNKRFDVLICSILSRIDNPSNSGLVIIEPGLSFNKCYSLLFPLISHSSFSLASCIRRIHFDGTYCNASDLSYEWLFDNDKKTLRFPNLKSLSLTRCLLMESLIKSVPLLIKHQLNELTLTFDEDMMELVRGTGDLSTMNLHKRKLLIMFQEFIRQLFSGECGLISLRLDIPCDDYCDLHQCLTPCNNLSSGLIYNQCQSHCLTLRHLQIRLEYTCFFEHLIEHVPSLENLCVYFQKSLLISPRTKVEAETLIQSNKNWFNKVPKLQCFTLQTKVQNDFEFAYLKWILNNLNHIQKLKLCLDSYGLYGTDNVIWNSVIDANFIRQYCMPDTIINLTHFDFDICSPCKLPMNNVDKIIHSFKIHPFFIDRQWTNVNCFFDPIMSCQHLSSFIYHTPRFLNNLINDTSTFYWAHTRYVSIDLHPSLYLFLEQFDELFPNVFCIKVYTEIYRNSNDSDRLKSFQIPFEIGKCKLSDIQFRNVTRLDFGPDFNRKSITSGPDNSIDRIKARAVVLAHLISMPNQLKDLRIAEFEWLLHLIQYASNKLKENALNTVRYAEFHIPSCHQGSNERIRIGKNLVPFLSSYMPHLQTLRLWRQDDFPWTSIRPDIKPGYLSTILIPRWCDFLRTSESINQHVNIFQQDLCQLLEKMKEFVFLDIHGEIHEEKLEPYRSMVQTHFPNSRNHVEISRFRLWL